MCLCQVVNRLPHQRQRRVYSLHVCAEIRIKERAVQWKAFPCLLLVAWWCRKKLAESLCSDKSGYLGNLSSQRGVHPRTSSSHTSWTEETGVIVNSLFQQSRAFWATNGIALRKLCNLWDLQWNSSSCSKLDLFRLLLLFPPPGHGADGGQAGGVHSGLLSWERSPSGRRRPQLHSPPDSRAVQRLPDQSPRGPHHLRLLLWAAGEPGEAPERCESEKIWTKARMPLNPTRSAKNIVFPKQCRKI